MAAARFKDVYDVKGRQISSITLNSVNFVLLNSMSFEGDDCSFCRDAKKQLEKVARQLECARNASYAALASSRCHSHYASTLSNTAPIVMQVGRRCVRAYVYVLGVPRVFREKIRSFIGLTVCRISTIIEGRHFSIIYGSDWQI